MKAVSPLKWKGSRPLNWLTIFFMFWYTKAKLFSPFHDRRNHFIHLFLLLLCIHLLDVYSRGHCVYYQKYVDWELTQVRGLSETMSLSTDNLKILTIKVCMRAFYESSEIEHKGCFDIIYQKDFHNPEGSDLWYSPLTFYCKISRYHLSISNFLHVTSFKFICCIT